MIDERISKSNNDKRNDELSISKEWLAFVPHRLTVDQTTRDATLRGAARNIIFPILDRFRLKQIKTDSQIFIGVPIAPYVNVRSVLCAKSKK